MYRIFVVVQSLSRVWLFVATWTATHQAFLFTLFWSLLKLMSIELVMPSKHLPSVTPFSSCPQSFPASGPFTMSWFLASGGQSIGALEQYVFSQYALGAMRGGHIVKMQVTTARGRCLSPECFLWWLLGQQSLGSYMQPGRTQWVFLKPNCPILRTASFSFQRLCEAAHSKAEFELPMASCFAANKD